MVKVKVEEGILEGEFVQNEYGGIYYSFKGIPYAEPPLADLRFKAPRPPKSWKGVRSAKEFGPICYQISRFPKGSEDCLYLNVYTPDILPDRPLPVMFWIHGGGFKSGSGNDDIYGPEFLVRHDVILVTFNYRLEVLGFLCLDTEDIPGNAGMKDQVAALRWVNKNISNFGGDPNNVTIFGVSSGAACVTYHMVSPMSKGLFQRVIIQSGAATCSWAITFEPRQRALALARKLGCESENAEDLYDFFKSQPLESIVRVKAAIRLSEEIREGLHVYFSVVSEKKFGDTERFFWGDIFDARLNCKNAVEIIIGYTEDEGFLSFAAYKNNLDSLLDQVNYLRDFMVPTPIANLCTTKQQLEVGSKFKKRYLKYESLNKDNFGSLAKYHSHEIFVYGMMQWIKLCVKTNSVYLYKFACKSERNFIVNKLRFNHVVGDRIISCHADDITYLFPAPIFCEKLDMNSKACKMIDNCTKLWTNFAKCGNPTPDSSLDVKWKPYTLKQQDYLKIDEELVSSTEPDKEDVEFWESIFEEYLPKQVIN